MVRRCSFRAPLNALASLNGHHNNPIRADKHIPVKIKIATQKARIENETTSNE
jgi:hypothetical protein